MVNVGAKGIWGDIIVGGHLGQIEKHGPPAMASQSEALALAWEQLEMRWGRSCNYFHGRWVGVVEVGYRILRVGSLRIVHASPEAVASEGRWREAERDEIWSKLGRREGSHIAENRICGNA
jgi:hypothetical protein